MRVERLLAMGFVASGYFFRGLALALLLSVLTGLLYSFFYIGCDDRASLLSLWICLVVAGVITWQLNKRVTTWHLVGIFLVLALLLQMCLTSLNASRAKPPEAALKVIVHNLRYQAEIYFDNTRSYAGLCNSTEVRASQQRAEEIDLSANHKRCLGIFWQLVLPKPPELIMRTEWYCKDTVASYVINTRLSSKEYYCVDNTGAATTTSVRGDTQCGR